MEKTQLPGMPERRAQDFDIGDGRFARVIYSPQESKPDRKVIEVQAFEVDGDGRFVSAPGGYPSRTPGTTHVIAASELGDTRTLQPGWVRVVGDYDATTLSPDAEVASALPESGVVGDQVYIDPTLYRWDIGELQRVMEGKAQDLANLIRQSNSLQDFEL